MRHNPIFRNIYNILLISLVSGGLLIVGIGCAQPEERDYGRELAEFDVSSPDENDIENYQSYLDAFQERTSSSESEIFDALVFTQINAQRLPADLTMLEVVMGIEEYMTELEDDDDRRQLEQEPDFLDVATAWLTLRAE